MGERSDDRGRDRLCSSVGDAAEPGAFYKCFIDASGGRHDHYTIAIAHKQDGRFIIDVVRGVGATQPQAVVVYRYVLGFLQSSPVLAQEIENVTAHEVRLRGNVVLSTRAGNYRTVRGRTLLAAIIDEVAFLRDETSSIPDIEVYRALLPALATTGGMLVGISTPYRRTGLLYQKHRDFYGIDDADVLVVAGNAKRFNPTIDVSIIERARASDPESARAEWDAE